MLPMWLETVKQAKVSNYLIVALDEQLRDYLRDHSFNHYYKPLQISKAQQGTGDNHGISALKFQILEEFLKLGWSVLLSDVDVAVLQNPFDHLYRDHDVEGMSDGFDAPTAYGHGNGIDDPSMGWSRYAQGTTHMHMNSGLFYLRANLYTINLMRRIAARLEKEKAWDQSVYNEEMFFLSHGDYVAANVDVRVMDIFQFMNTKILFKVWRHLPKAQQKMPVMVHINYHPDKEQRLRAVIDYFLHDDKGALAKFPGGSEPGS
ncbi:hypothetical protein WJX84_008354 [Apatococcus fuscideae]|uniref:Glycosyltransferase n=1 Tax=Apatococcus fuscideae TaxID=2026836 RepID=A0AAW1SVU6_9CHLO